MTHPGQFTMILTQTLASAPPLAGRAASANGAPATPGAAIETTPVPNGGGPPAGQPSSGLNMLLVMGAVMVFLIVISTISGNKEKKKRAQLLASVGLHDRVQTIGGVIGTVVQVRDDEIILRVDDANNTRITFARSAVQGILKKRPDSPAEAAAAA